MVQQLEAPPPTAAATTTLPPVATTATTTAAPAAPQNPPSRPRPLPPRQESGVPVYVMLPLDTVDGEGRFRYGVVSPPSGNTNNNNNNINGNGNDGNGNNNSPPSSSSPSSTSASTGVTPWFARALKEIAAAGAHGVAVDVWWGAVERSPRQYDFGGYKALAEAVRDAGLRLQVVLSFHACGGNVGDDAAIPLPSWVERAALEQDADLFYADAPRGGAPGRRNPECVSLFADGDELEALGARSPMQCYAEFMEAFRSEFEAELGGSCDGNKRDRKTRMESNGGDGNSSSSTGTEELNGSGGGDDGNEVDESSLAVIDEVVVGAGPCGELRYPSYFEPHGWRFPGVGEFQCHDRRARASLAEAARAAGRPEWGYSSPHDAGSYNDAPDGTGFFAGWGGAWDSDYGKFFVRWYASELLKHGERLAEAAVRVFGLSEGEEGEADDDEEDDAAAADDVDAAAAKATASPPPPPPPPTPATTITSVPSFPSLRREARSTSLASMDSDSAANATAAAAATNNASANNGKNSFLGRNNNLNLADAALQQPAPWIATGAAAAAGAAQGNDTLPRRPRGLSVALKVAGVHWWYRHPSHAAELTAGYSNARSSGESYDAIVSLCASANLGLTLTCVEMCDGQHPPEALCGPEGLLRQVREAAAAQGVPLGGENALPVFGPGHADGRALARVAYNTDAWAPPLQEAARARDELYGSPTNNDENDGGRGDGGGDNGGGGGEGWNEQRQQQQQQQQLNKRRSSDGSGASSPRSPASSQPAPSSSTRPPSSSPAGGGGGGATAPPTPPSPSTLPPMRSFTFLRLTPSMLEPPISDEWRAFMRRMRGNGSGGGNGSGNGSDAAMVS